MSTHSKQKGPLRLLPPVTQEGSPDEEEGMSPAERIKTLDEEIEGTRELIIILIEKIASGQVDYLKGLATYARMAGVLTRLTSAQARALLVKRLLSMDDNDAAREWERILREAGLGEERASPPGDYALTDDDEA